MSEWEEIQAAIRAIQSQLEEVETVNNSWKRVAEDAAKFQKHARAEYDEQVRVLTDKLNTETAQSREDQRLAQQKMRETYSNIQLLKDRLNGLNKNAVTMLEKQAAAAKLNEAEKKIIEIAAESIWWKLGAEFQREDITFIVNAFMTGKRGVANFNDMGTGKTMETAGAIQVLTHLFYQLEGRMPRRLWLTKKSLMRSNIAEVLKWTPNEMPVICKGSNPEPMRDFAIQMAVAANQILVANYEVARSTPNLKNVDWDFVIIDEVHKLKGGANPQGSTAVWASVRDICKPARFVIMLSGTPIVNHPREMWSYLHIFDPEKFPAATRGAPAAMFERMYCWGYGEAGVQVDWTRLIKTLSGQSFRRTKAECKIQLPDRIREERFVEMNGEQEVAYEQLRQNFFLWLDEQHEKALTTTAIIAQLTRLRQLSIWPNGITIKNAEGVIVGEVNVKSSAKLDEAMDIIEELTEADEQVVVFTSQFAPPLRELKRRCDEKNLVCDIIDGSTSQDANIYEERFQQKKSNVLAINMQTGSEGMNLQKNPNAWPGGASTCIMLDQWWSPALNDQAGDRLHRMGAPLEETVTIIVLKAETSSGASVDNFIQGILDKKTSMIHGIVESDELRSPAEWKLALKDVI
jgi:SNF2 family DNA or RNA helicase